MNFFERFFAALCVIVVSIVGSFVVVGIVALPVFVPMLFGLNGASAVAMIIGLYLILGAAFMAACTDF